MSSSLEEEKTPGQILQTWDDGFRIRLMKLSDARHIQEWFAKMSPTGRDLETALIANTKGDGFYAGDYNGKLVAGVIGHNVGGDVHDISSLYIEKEYQRKGFANRLLIYLVKRHNDDVMFGDTYPHNKGIYSKLTRTEEIGGIDRYTGTVEGTEWRLEYPVDTREISVSDLEEIIQYDNKCYIVENSAQRRSLLKAWLCMDGSRACAAVNDSGQLIGYGCRRPTYTDGHYIIGPLYADSFEVAHTLVVKLADDIVNETVYIEFNATQPEKVRLAEALGMKHHTEFVTMWSNVKTDTKTTRNEYVYGVTSLDICGR